MSSIVVAGDTSGSVTLSAPAVAGSTTLTLPSVSGTVLTTGSSVITSGTAVASTSGTSIDFTGIPSTAKRITVMFSGVSTNGTSNPLIQIGNGTNVTTGYVSSSINLFVGTPQSSSATNGMVIDSNVATNFLSGTITLNLVSGNIWISSHNLGGVGNMVGGGTVTLSSTLDRIRITTVNGTDTFDAGSINIFWE